MPEVNVHTFNGGMNQDLDKSYVGKDMSYQIENFRITTKEGLSTASLENIEGNNSLSLTFKAGQLIVDSCLIRDRLIIFTTNNTSATPSGGNSMIYEVVVNTTAETATLSVLYDDSDTKDGSTLNLSTANRVKALGRYENSNIQKVYWIDTYNDIRFANIAVPLTNDLETKSSSNYYANVDKLSFIPDTKLNNPKLVDVVSGNIYNGSIQYSYQLYRKNGSETVFSQPSGLYAVTPSNEFLSNDSDYKGGLPDINSGKGFKIEINNKYNSGFNRCRIVAIHYSNLHSLPIIRIAGEFEIDFIGDTFTFIDTGTNLGEYTNEEFSIIASTIFTPKDIAIKDDILFAANIDEETFDVDFDARAYRFTGASTTSSDYNYNSVYNQECRVYNSDDSYYIIETNGNWTAYDSAGSATGVTGTNWSLPETEDCINKYNDLDNDGDDTYRFMYKSNGESLGGEGVNISYTFAIKSVDIDDASDARGIEAPLDGSTENPSYSAYSSPFLNGDYVGYQRDETYRYGIQFFDERGIPSFVKWIADVRTPSISTIDDKVTYVKGGSTTYQEVKITFNSLGGDVYTIVLSDGSIAGSETYTYTESTGDGIETLLLYFNEQINLYSSVAESTIGSNFITVKYTGIESDVITTTVDSLTTPVATYITQVLTVHYSTSGTSYKNYALTSEYGKVNILYPIFNVDLTGTDAEGYGYQIVRVIRNKDDHSILAQGIVSGTDNTPSSSDRTPFSWSTSSGWETDIVCFQSPEIAFNKNLVVKSNDKLQLAGVLSTISTSNVNGVNVYKYTNISVLSSEFATNNFTDVSLGSIVEMTDVSAIIGDITYIVNSSGNFDKGVNLVTKISNSSWSGLNTAYSTARNLVNYRRNVYEKQYGGITNSSKQTNQYIATSNIQYSDTGNVSTFGGDTYIGIFDYQFSSWEDGTASGCVPEVVYFPVESTINLNLRHDDCYHRVYNRGNIKYIHETLGTWGNGTDTYEQYTNLYEYNSVYSQENDVKTFFPKPFDFDSVVNIDVRVRASDKKINGEMSDSWTKFRPNEYIDVDSTYGPVNNLYTFKDKLMYFQDTAFGVLSVNDRSLITDNNLSMLTLGTGGVLPRYDYVSTKIGNNNRFGIVSSTNSLYWIYNDEKAMYRFSQTDQPLSKIKGMQSWFNSIYDTSTDVVGVFDLNYNEVIFSLNGVSSATISYSEFADKYISFYSFISPMYIGLNNKYYLTTNSALNQLYIHNSRIADKCTFYGVTYTSNISYIVNDNYSNTKVFDNIKYESKSVNNIGVDIFDDTFNRFRISNDYQNTDWVTLDSSNLTRRERSWAFVIPRNVVNKNVSTNPDIFAGANLDPTQKFKERIRDKFIMVEFQYDNRDSYKFICPFINTSYRISRR